MRSLKKAYTCRIFPETREGKRSLGRFGPKGEDNIKIYLYRKG
jgi:hypothetical protein